MSNLLKIKNNVTNQFVKVNVTSYAVDYDKNFGSAVKNMVGSTRSTLIGIGVQVKAQTEPLLQNQVEPVLALLNQAYMVVQFFNPATGEVKEAPFTSSDLSMKMIRENGKWYEEISFTLTSVDMTGFIS